MLTGVKVSNITAFDSIDIKLSNGVNVFIGTNGTGKTHLMKLLYASMLIADNSFQKNIRFISFGKLF